MKTIPYNLTINKMSNQKSNSDKKTDTSSCLPTLLFLGCLYFERLVASKDRNFGNARTVRNFFEKDLERQANRLSKETNLTSEKLTEICVEDINL